MGVRGSVGEKPILSTAWLEWSLKNTRWRREATGLSKDTPLKAAIRILQRLLEIFFAFCFWPICWNMELNYCYIKKSLRNVS